MDIFSVLTLLGGLAMFLYGMHTMSGGLEKLSGSKLQSTLQKMTALIVCMPYRNSASPPKSEMIEYTSIVSLPVFCNTPINLFYIITELRQKATQTFTARSFA